MRCVTLKNVILLVILSKKCSVNIWLIINSYIAESILMHIHIYNQKFYSAGVLLCCTNKKKVTCQITPQKKDVH
jgi:hypothetical protein